MRQFTVLAAFAGCISIVSTSASAQEVGIYVGPSYGYGPAYERDYYYGSDYRYRPPVYGYSRRIEDGVDAEVDLGRPTGPGGCGTYRFWNGERCVDARNR
jgi:hypothetical protein